jgi:hypothetical protein
MGERMAEADHPNFLERAARPHRDVGGNGCHIFSAH